MRSPTAVLEGAPRRVAGGGARAVAVVAGLGVVAALVVVSPGLAAGAVLGGILLWVTMSWPLAVVGVVLALGPVDFSFLTGGVKGLFPQLGGLDMNGIRLVGISLALTLVIASDRDWLRALGDRTGRFFLIFLLYATATMAWSLDPLEGARLLFKLAYPLLVFLVVAAPGRTRRELSRVADWVLVGATLVLLMNPFLVLAGGYQVDVDGRLRVGSLGLHENPFSFYLLVVIVMCVGRFAERGGKRYLLLAAFAAGWMALTLTRITLGASLVGLGGMALYGGIVNRNYRVALGAGALAALIALALTPVAMERTFGYRPSLDELRTLASDPVTLFNAMKWSGRELFWPVLLAAWATSPVFGLGLGTSTALMLVNFPPEYGTVVHNEYIRLGVDTGLVGVALFFVATAAWLGAVVRAGRSQKPGVREFALPALAAILAWAVISATDNAFDYYSTFTQFVGFLVGGAVVVARQREEVYLSDRA